MAPSMEVTPGKVWDEIKSGRKVRLVDVRTPVEFSQVRAEKAELLPLQDLNKEKCEKLRASLEEGESVYLICKSGSRSAKAAEILEENQVPMSGVVLGGTDAWVTEGLPVLRTSKVISLERQVRIAVGIPVLIFSLLAIFVHPLFALGSLFFGCGLTFAGITDWCGMALVIAKMPWNRQSPDLGASCSIR